MHKNAKKNTKTAAVMEIKVAWCVCVCVYRCIRTCAYPHAGREGYFICGVVIGHLLNSITSTKDCASLSAAVTNDHKWVASNQKCILSHTDLKSEPNIRVLIAFPPCQSLDRDPSWGGHTELMDTPSPPGV